MPLKKLCVSVLLAGSLGCTTDTSDHDFAIDKLEPFRGLAGIRLGMRADSFKKLRPQVTLMTYSGYSEAQGSTTLMYYFTQSTAVGTIPQNAKLIRFGSFEAASDSLSGAEAWVRNVARTSKEMAVAPTCFTKDDQFGSKQVALWPAGKTSVEVAFRVPKSLSGDRLSNYTTVGEPLDTAGGSKIVCPK